jgi:uncharacterized protein (TIGR00255 family)
MTGYGKGTSYKLGRQLKVELRSLNGKMSDVRLKAPTKFREKEIEIRNLIMEGALRGKIDATLSLDGNAGDEEFGLNVNLFKAYLKTLQQIKEEEGIPQSDLIGAVMRFPNVVQAMDSTLTDDEWDVVRQCIIEALEQLNDFRKSEGAALEASILQHIGDIESQLLQVDPLEMQRVDQIKSRIKGSLEEHFASDNIDKNRFEQEILYYLEKLDISEEKNRLSQHCIYFREVLKDPTLVKGKKLSFISQEMGREINTMGAKAQSSGIQKLVVGMKDDLEKIKEQLANVV